VESSHIQLVFHPSTQSLYKTLFRTNTNIRKLGSNEISNELICWCTKWLKPLPCICSLCSADFEYVKRSMPRDLACADALIIRPILSPWKHWTPFSPQWQTYIADAFGNIQVAVNCQPINILFSWFINKTLLTEHVMQNRNSSFVGCVLSMFPRGNMQNCIIWLMTDKRTMWFFDNGVTWKILLIYI